MELTHLEQVTRELINHTSRTEIRRRNQLISEFHRLATPEVVLQLILAAHRAMPATQEEDPHGRADRIGSHARGA